MIKIKKIFLLSILLGFVVSLGSCGKPLDKNAKSMITGVLDQLKSGHTQAFLQAVLPQQQQKFAPFISKARYFTTLKDYTFMDDLTNVTDEKNAQVVVYMKYPQNTRTMFRIYLDKVGGKWYINFQETYDAEKRKNGANAFSGIKYK